MDGSVMRRAAGRRAHWALTYRQLMSKSEDLISTTLVHGRLHERSIAARLTEDSKRYHDWEVRHAGLMRSAADRSTATGQVYFLRSTVLSLAHVGSVTRLIQREGLRGADRVTLIKGLHRGQDYVGALIREHRNYVRAEASSMCAQHVDQLLLGDRWFQEAYDRYMETLDNYMSLLRGAIEAEARGQPYPLTGFLIDTKRLLSRQRNVILDSALQPSERARGSYGTLS